MRPYNPCVHLLKAAPGTQKNGETCGTLGWGDEVDKGA